MPGEPPATVPSLSCSKLHYSPRLYTFFFGLLTIIFNLIWRRSLPLSKWLPLIVAAFLPDRNTSIRHTESGEWIEPPPPWIKNLSGAISLIALGLLGCLQVSALCIASGRVLSRLAARRAEHSEGFSDASLPTTSPDADRPGSTSRFHVADAFWQGIGWLKAVFVGLCKAVDNHGEWLKTWYTGFSMSTEQFVLACGIFNLLSVLLYYLVVFDSIGTSSPSWTTVLG